VTNETELSFDPESYSMFKYGCGKTANHFANYLAMSFIDDFMESNKHMWDGKQLVFISPPHHGIPTAADAMKTVFTTKLNLYLNKKSHNVCELAKIERRPSYTMDYGNMESEERKNRLTGDSFYLDKTFVKDKFLILLDDIRVTGAHEDRVANVLQKAGVSNSNCVYVYFAKVLNTEINPKIEDELNHAYVKRLVHVDNIITEGEFVLNTRVTKLILSDKDMFMPFIESKSDAFCRTLLSAGLLNGYHKDDKFRDNLNVLINRLHHTKYEV